MTTQLLTIVVLTCLGYLLLTNVVAMVFILVGAVENAVRRHDSRSADYSTLASSRFTIPVSVIVAAYNEEAVIENTVRSLLDFEYPEFEVIVANPLTSNPRIQATGRVDGGGSSANWQIGRASCRERV